MDDLGARVNRSRAEAAEADASSARRDAESAAARAAAAETAAATLRDENASLKAALDDLRRAAGTSEARAVAVMGRGRLIHTHDAFALLEAQPMHSRAFIRLSYEYWLVTGSKQKTSRGSTLVVCE